MAAFFTTPGPIFIYVNWVYQGGTPTFLGTAVTAPEVEGRPAYINVLNDLSGRSVPGQKVYDGEQDIVTVTLNRFDFGVYTQLKSQSKVAAAAGFNTPLNRGSLAFTQTDFQLILVNSFFGTAQASPVLTSGRLYYSALLTGWRESTVGTRVEEVALVFECNAPINPTSSTPGAFGSFNLYTETLPGLPVPS